MNHPRAFLAAAGSLIGLAAPVSATVLTFEIGATTQGTVLPDTYGDNVTGDGTPSANFDYDQGNNWTPNITVEYRTLNSSQVQTHPFMQLNNDYSSGSWVAWPPAPTGRAEITFVPEPGQAVRINSFQLATWPATNTTGQGVDTIRITDVTRALDLWTPSGHNGNAEPNELFSPNYTGAPGATIRLQFGHNWNVAFENVNFDQVAIPEPASAATLAVGALATALLGRNARRRA